MCIVTECMHWNLYQVLHHPDHATATLLNITTRMQIMKGVACGIHHFHNILNNPHGDINPTNILLNESLDIVKIADPTPLSYLLCGGGSFYYKAPELLLYHEDTETTSQHKQQQHTHSPLAIDRHVYVL